MRRVHRKKWLGNVEIVVENIRKSESFSDLIKNFETVQPFVLYKGNDGVYSSKHIKDALDVLQDELERENAEVDTLEQTEAWDEYSEKITSEFGIRDRIGKILLQ